MKKYILLDWDGNLAKTLDVWIVACRAPLEKRGLYFSDEEIATCFGIPFERFTEWGILDVDTAISEMDELAASLLPEVELYPDALFVLEELRRTGKKTALITTSLRNNVVNLLNKYGINDYFNAIIAYEDTLKHKPNPEPLVKALQLLGANKQEAIMIGDSDKDICAAANAGVDSILFYPSEHKKFYKLDDLQALNPTHIVDDFRQVLQIV
jgi:pyrophosphatase PpaX